MISQIDYLYWVLYPELSNNEFKTQKVLEFLYWSIALVLKKHGFLTIEEGRELYFEIKENINTNKSNKLSTSKNYKKLLSQNSIFNKGIEFHNKKPIYDLNLTHDKNARMHRKL